MLRQLSKLLAPLVVSMVLAQECNHSATRIKSPQNFIEWLEDPTNGDWKDVDFEQYDMLYWRDFIDHDKQIELDEQFNKNAFFEDKLDFQKLGHIYEPRDATSLWEGDIQLQISDVRTGIESDGKRDWYAAGMSAVAPQAAQVVKLFASGESTKIYGVTLFVRGKPWIITVDNYIPVIYKGYKLYPWYGDIYRYHTWAPVLEKAMAKVMGNYNHLNSGHHPINGLRMLTGAPVFNINFGDNADPASLTVPRERLDQDQFEWQGKKYNHIAASIFQEVMSNRIDNGFPMVAQTRNDDYGLADLSGLALTRTFTVLGAIHLYDFRKPGKFGSFNKIFTERGDATSKGQVIILRDPSGQNTYTGELENPLDPASKYWNEAPGYPDMIKQIVNYNQYFEGNPNEITGDKGVFALTSNEFFNAFQSIQIAHDRSDYTYKSTWFDVENDFGEEKDFYVTIPDQDKIVYYEVEEYNEDTDEYEMIKKTGDLYFMVETYYQGSVPLSCYSGLKYPTSIFKVYQNGVLKYDSEEKEEKFHVPFWVKEGTFKAGDKFKFEVKYNWQNGFDLNGLGNPAPSSDYTMSAYSLQNLEIFDLEDTEDNEDIKKTNQINMDGKCPSGLLNTNLNYCEVVHKADRAEPVRLKTFKTLADVFTKTTWPEFVGVFFNNPRLWLPIFWFDWLDLFLTGATAALDAAV